MKIVFTKSKKKFAIFSWIVSLYEKEKYSHVAIQIGDYYIQASEGKVNKEYKDFFLKEHKVLAIYKVSPIPLEYLEMELGRNYGWAQNIGIILVDLLKNIGIKINNPFRSGVNCSEFVYEKVLKKLNPQLNYKADSIKPSHVEQILRRSGAKREL